MLGAIGADPVGDIVLEELRTERVEVEHVRRLASHSTPTSIIIVEPGGERTIIADSTIDLTRLPVPDLPAAHFDAVLVDARWSAATRRALEMAQRAGVPGVVDVDRLPAEPDLLDAASHLVFSESALVEFAGSDDLEAGLRDVAGTTTARLSVTAGERGVFWLDDGSVRHLDAFEVDTVDTTGAGDVFHGAFALALAEGTDEADAFRFASATAALKCSRPGARAGIPTEPTSSDSSPSRNRHRLDVDELEDPLGAEFAPETRALDATERKARIRGDRLVDEHRPGVHPIGGDARTELDVAGVDGATESERRPIGQLDRLVRRAEREPPPPPDRTALRSTRHCRWARRSGSSGRRTRWSNRPGADHRDADWAPASMARSTWSCSSSRRSQRASGPSVVDSSSGSPTTLFASSSVNAPSHVVVDVVVDEKALRTDARLATVDEPTHGAAGRRGGNVRVRKHDGRVGPAEFEHDLLEVRTGECRDGPAGCV